MTLRRTVLTSAAALLALSLAGPTFAHSSKELPVVATFSILGDMVARIGGDHIKLTTLVGPDGDAHVYQSTPADARAVSKAEVLFVNGLEFEGWIDRLVEASDFHGARVVATAGIDAIPFEEHHDDHAKHDDHGHDKHDDHAKHDDHGHDDHAKHDDHEHAKHDDHHGHDHGAFDPHAWQSLAHAVTYVDNIAAALAKADSANASHYYANRAAYVAEIKALEAEVKAMIAAIPENKRTVVTSHDAFQYFGREYGLTFLAPQGVSTESEASAKDVAHLIEQMREEGISAVFIENINDPRLLEQIARETGAAIGGTLYPGALSGSDGPASTYLKMMRHNAMTLSKAIGS